MGIDLNKLAMSKEDKSKLLGEKLFVKLATVRKDGRPHLAPLWFHYDGKKFHMTTHADTLKVGNIRRNQNVALLVDTPYRPSKAVLVEGKARLLEDESDVEYWSRKLGEKYRGKGGGEIFLRRMPAKGRVCIEVTPAKTLNWDRAKLDNTKPDDIPRLLRGSKHKD